MGSLEAEGSVRISELLLLLLLHHRAAASEPVVPHGVGTPLHLGVHEPLVRTVAELCVAAAEGIVESALESGRPDPDSSSGSGSGGGAELGRGREPAALIEAAAAAPRKALRRSSL